MNTADMIGSYGCIGAIFSLLFLFLVLAAIAAVFDIRRALWEMHKILWNETEGKRTGVAHPLRAPRK